MDFRAIRQASGLTQAVFAERFGIPKRTIEDWDRGVAAPPPYVLRMLAQLLGLLPTE